MLWCSAPSSGVKQILQDASRVSATSVTHTLNFRQRSPRHYWGHSVKTKRRRREKKRDWQNYTWIWTENRNDSKDLDWTNLFSQGHLWSLKDNSCSVITIHTMSKTMSFLIWLSWLYHPKHFEKPSSHRLSSVLSITLILPYSMITGHINCL